MIFWFERWWAALRAVLSIVSNILLRPRTDSAAAALEELRQVDQDKQQSIDQIREEERTTVAAAETSLSERLAEVEQRYAERERDLDVDRVRAELELRQQTVEELARTLQTLISGSRVLSD